MLFKLSNLNSNLALTLGYLNPALNNSAQDSRLHKQKISPIPESGFPYMGRWEKRLYSQVDYHFVGEISTQYILILELTIRIVSYSVDRVI